MKMKREAIEQMKAIQAAVDGRHDLVWGSMLYRCGAGHVERMYLGVGVEGPLDLREAGTYIPSPFMIDCRTCGEPASHVNWQGDEKSWPQQPLPGVRYFAVPRRWRARHRRRYGSAVFCGEVRSSDDGTVAEPIEGGCPRQVEATMAVQLEHVARWETDRWSRPGERWPEGSKPPRTCSYCGGVHPDDAIGLVEAGWEVEKTGKIYKRYLHPPGYGRHVKKLMALLREDMLEGDSQEPEFVGPSLPVKLYVMHFDQEQVERFNAAVHAGSAAETNVS